MIEDPEHLTWALGVGTRGGGKGSIEHEREKAKTLSLYKEGEYQASSP